MKFIEKKNTKLVTGEIYSMASKLEEVLKYRATNSRSTIMAETSLTNFAKESPQKPAVKKNLHAKKKKRSMFEKLMY